MKRRTRHRRDKRCFNRTGAAAVEMAVCAPLLFLLVFGMIDIGRALMVQHLLTNAARDGARAAILEGVTSAEVEQDLTDYLSLSSVPGATITVTPTDLQTADIGDPVSVTCSVPFSSVGWLGSSLYLEGIDLEATVIMRRETTASTTGEESY
jgi:Flp pilus assembly protein TadG